VLAARAVLVVLAAAVIAWMAVQLAAVAANDELVGVAYRPLGDPSPAELRAADAEVRTAERLNADRAPSVVRGATYLRAGRADDAVRVFTEVTRDEPENLPAWAMLVRAARANGDQALAARALARQRELAPPVPGPPR
jgi:hypothetical protein